MSEQEGRQYFRYGRFSVTASMVRARNRSIQLATIEGIEVTRPVFFIAFCIFAGLAGATLAFGDLLYIHEKIILGSIATLLIVLTWNIGALKVFSKLTRQKGWTVYWWIGPLRKMREAVETAMDDRALRRS